MALAKLSKTDLSRKESNTPTSILPHRGGGKLVRTGLHGNPATQ